MLLERGGSRSGRGAASDEAGESGGGLDERCRRDGSGPEASSRAWGQPGPGRGLTRPVTVLGRGDGASLDGGER